MQQTPADEDGLGQRQPSRKRRVATALLVAGLALFLGLLLALPQLAETPPPGLPGTASLADEAPDLGLPPLAPEAALPRRPGFVDGTTEARLAFRQVFLEREQGFTFQANQYNHGSGMVIDDVDRDGHPDVYFLNQLGDNGLFRNLGDGTFEDITYWAGLQVGDRVCSGASFADVDNDGDADLYVTSYRGGNLLHLNDGQGRFEDVTTRAGLGAIVHSCSATFFDAENDGDLDLYLVNVGKFTSGETDPESQYFSGTSLGLYYGLEKGEPDYFYRNRGDGTFVDETKQVGLADTSWGGDVAAGDIDDDGDLDLMIANMYGEDILLVNDRGERFVNETRKRLPTTGYGSMASTFLDVDNDLDMDIFVIDMHSDMWLDFDFPLERIRAGVRYSTPFGIFDFNLGKADLLLMRSLPQNRHTVFGNTLMVNDGTGHFVERGEEAHTETFWPWGAQQSDLDHDGDLDIFIPSGMGFPWEWWPNAVLINQGDGTFREEGVSRGLDDLEFGHYLERYRLWGRAYARSVRAGGLLDYDADGDEDVITNGYNCHATLWRNVFPRDGRHWVQLDLRGTASNRDAVGAKVILEAGGRKQLRYVRGAQGYISQSWRVLTFGLAQAQRVDSVQIRWPSGRTQSVTVPAVDRRYIITEGETDPVLWVARPVKPRLPDQEPAVPGWEPIQKETRETAPLLGNRPGMGVAPAHLLER